jgi:hypothetical protein
MVFHPPVSAQTPPHISSIVSSADFSPGITLNSFGTIFGTGLSDAVYQASSMPFPTSLGPTRVALCLPGETTQIQSPACADIQLIFVSPTQINFLVFASLPPGFGSSGGGAGLTAVVAVNGTLDDASLSGNDFDNAGLLSGNSPKLFFEGYDCYIDPSFPDSGVGCGLSPSPSPSGANQARRGAITDAQGAVLTSGNPATLGRYYTAWMTGFWLPQKNVQITISDVPHVTPRDPLNVIVETASFAGGSLQFPGLYQVNFLLPTQLAGGSYVPGGIGPPLLPCGNYSWEVSISFVGSAIVQIPILVKPGDVPCTQ